MPSDTAAKPDRAARPLARSTPSSPCAVVEERWLLQGERAACYPTLQQEWAPTAPALAYRGRGNKHTRAGPKHRGERRDGMAVGKG